MVEKLFKFGFLGDVPQGSYESHIAHLQTEPYFLLDLLVYKIWFQSDRNCYLQRVYTHTHISGHFKSKETFITKIHISRYVDLIFMFFMSKNSQYSVVLEYLFVFTETAIFYQLFEKKYILTPMILGLLKFDLAGYDILFAYIVVDAKSNYMFIIFSHTIFESLAYIQQYTQSKIKFFIISVSK